MIQVYEYDENFILTKPVAIEPDEEGNYTIPENCTIVQPPSFIKAMYHPAEKTWTEAATEEEKEELEKQIENGRVSSPVDLLKMQNAKLSLQVAATEKENAQRRQREADTALLIAQLQKDITDLKEGK
ncbi:MULTISPECIES: hypothetical protein [Bacillus amyloliquefaciens group]|uniref:Bacteriophage SP-beta YorD domain-containing protein n=1 Tax=Bacillus velezensis TaxID=492670 RepID=A0ABC8DCV3_BACVE|nr:MULTISPECIES: hypothetical protein [Bacillus amyloliquefaciens group]AVI29808.1 hypothetical protein C3Z10_16140 [Bacillus velezensis]AWX73460.1 hypothetical protein BVDSYZ_16155 [Bacillus velezensis]AXT11974.1 hypothetical protein D0U03_05950 [Bacillus velezensis]MDK2561091.1 hypothetical protein [Bacillus amyloliquefaciens]WEC92695.1 hypothetical protein PT966_06110 [Bacillus velezensis]